MVIDGMHYSPNCNCRGCRMVNSSKKKIGKAIDVKNNLYLEPLNLDFNKRSCVSNMYIFQKAINNIIEVLNKISQSNIKK